MNQQIKTVVEIIKAERSWPRKEPTTEKREYFEEFLSKQGLTDSEDSDTISIRELTDLEFFLRQVGPPRDKSRQSSPSFW